MAANSEMDNVRTLTRSEWRDEGDLLIYFPSLVHTPWDGPWDEWVGNGSPALGNPQRAMFYPPAWPLRWAFVAWLPFYLWLHHALAAIGAWAWLRRKGPGWGPVIGGALYGGIAARVLGIPSAVSTLTGLGPVFRGTTLKMRILRRLVSVGLRFARSPVPSATQ